MADRDELENTLADLFYEVGIVEADANVSIEPWDVLVDVVQAVARGIAEHIVRAPQDECDLGGGRRIAIVEEARDRDGGWTKPTTETVPLFRIVTPDPGGS